MTDLGSFENPLSMHGERWRLETRTDDPASPADDERWVRTDLDDDNRLATIKCGDGTEIPIFPTGTAEETVREAIRVRVNGQTGYAPIVPVDDSNIPARRIQHDGQPHAFHDRVAPGSATPDSLVSRPDDNNVAVDRNSSTELGVRISTSQDWPSIGARLSQNGSNRNEAKIYRVSDGTMLDSVDISGVSAGGAFTFDDVSLSANADYNIIVTNSSAWESGFYDAAVFPYASSDGNLEIVNGANGATGTDGNTHNILEVGNVGFN